MGRSRLVSGGIAAIALGIVASSANATTINFDNLSDNGAGFTQIANGYAGLNWSNFFVLNTPLFTGAQGPNGYANGLVSSPNVAYNFSSLPTSIASGSTFTLSDLYLTAAWNDGLKVQITGRLGGNPVDTVTEVIDTAGPTHVTLNWSGIDEVDFVSSGGVNHGFTEFGGEQFALDNLTVTSSVPEPATWATVFLGMLGLGAVLRQRRGGTVMA